MGSSFKFRVSGSDLPFIYDLLKFKIQNSKFQLPASSFQHPASSFQLEKFKVWVNYYVLSYTEGWIFYL
ncbi:hypothetical protein DHD80_03915 [Gramella sp. AN32]|nr:hypothetical protein [Gramella sp. AN32]